MEVASPREKGSRGARGHSVRDSFFYSSFNSYKKGAMDLLLLYKGGPWIGAPRDKIAQTHGTLHIKVVGLLGLFGLGLGPDPWCSLHKSLEASCSTSLICLSLIHI